MKNTWLNVFWGILLILGGGLFLAQNLGYLEEFSATTWMYIFIGASVLFFGTYFVSGIQHWGWLFPACIFGGTAITMALGEAGVSSSAVGAPVIIGAGLPFLVVFGLDMRKNWWALIPAFIFGMITMLLFIADLASGEAIGTALLYSFAVPFVVTYLTNTRERKWALIPAYVFAVVGTLPWISTSVRGEVIGALVMFAIGLPFLIVFLWNRKNTWGLIVAFILASVGVIPLLTTFQAKGETIGAFVMFAIALPFWVVFLVSRQNWWAVIPAGILTSVGATVFLIGIWNFDDAGVAMLNGAMNLGIAATFFLLWLRRGDHPVDWAKYPAVAFLIFGAITLIFGTSFNLYWPFLLIAAGILVLLFNLRPRHI